MAGSNEAVAEQAWRPAYGTARVTPQRRRIAQAAASMGAFTIEDLAARLESQRPKTPLATLYRAVRALESAGTVQKVGTRKSSDLYVWCPAEDHHHHLVCTGCGAVAHAPCPFGQDPSLPSEMAGYTLVRHEMTLFGLCGACTQAASRESGELCEADR